MGEAKKSTMPNIEIKDLRKSISMGNIQTVVEELITFTEGSSSNLTTEIYFVSARYRTMESDKLRGVISLEDYKLEFNTIIGSLLEIVDRIQHAAAGTFQQVCPLDQVKVELEEMSVKFKEADEIKSPPSMFRTKIHIARKMADRLIPWPKLLKEYEGTSDPAMICAICRKVKVVAEVTDLNILESILPNAESNIEKGFLTNALAEMIYAGQLMWGDEERLQAMLDQLNEKKEDPVLTTNVARVQAALDVMTGVMKL